MRHVLRVCAAPIIESIKFHPGVGTVDPSVVP